MNSVVHSNHSIHAFIHSFICSYVFSFMHSSIHSCTSSFLPSVIDCLVRVFERSIISSSIHSVVPLFIHSFGHSIVPVFIHSFFLSLIPVLRQIQAAVKALRTRMESEMQVGRRDGDFVVLVQEPRPILRTSLYPPQPLVLSSKSVQPCKAISD